MKPPPLLLGATVLFWGSQTGFLIFASGMAILFEGARYSRWRWQLTQIDFNRIADLCAIFMIAITIIFFLGNQETLAIFKVLQWLPICLLPLIAAEMYSVQQHTSMSSLFYSLRKLQNRHKDKQLSIQYAYFTLCIFAASAGNQRGLLFYSLICVLIAWALWSIRPKSTKSVVWVPLVTLAISLGYIGQSGLNNLHDSVEIAAAEWLADLLQAEQDPYQTMTAIGHIGKLKFSDRIIMRVEKDDPRILLLREASYNRMINHTWFVRDRSFHPINAEPDSTTTWRFAPDSDNQQTATISRNFSTRSGILALPTETFLISGIPHLSLHRNSYGTTKITEVPDQIRYTVQYDSTLTISKAPFGEDLQVPINHQNYLQKIIDQLKLNKKTDTQKVATITQFFKTQFRYSLYQPQRNTSHNALEHFLFKDRYGHCEYFASATVLLLRQMGIAARYTVGYSVQEYSSLEQRYIVRARHAHAWTQAYIDGYWQDIDTTPATWHNIEDEAASIWQPVIDFLSWIINFFAEESDGSDDQSMMKNLWLWLLLIPFSLLAWRVMSRKNTNRLVRPIQLRGTKRFQPQETHTAFHLILTQLHNTGFTRPSHEPLTTWFDRLSTTLDVNASHDELRHLLLLYYRFRFDPQGLTPAEQQHLDEATHRWLQRNSTVRKITL